MTRPARIFVVYRDMNHKWRWHLVARNNRITAESGQGYTRLDDALEAIHRELDLVQTAEIEVRK